jgi:hypothetical protein
MMTITSHLPRILVTHVRANGQAQEGFYSVVVRNLRRSDRVWGEPFMQESSVARTRPDGGS